jgi:hypothetical protein
MTANDTAQNRPLWLSIEDRILGIDAGGLSAGNLEKSIQNTAVDLDGAGFNVSTNAGYMLQLRSAFNDRVEVGRPLMEDFKGALGALALDDVIDPYKATVTLINKVGEAWPRLKESDRRPDVRRIIDSTRLDLLIVRARELGGEQGIRFLIEEDVESGVIIEALGIADDEFGRVNAAVEAERAERVRVTGLIHEAQDKPDEEKVKHLISGNVTDELILELGGFDEGLIGNVRKSMEEEMKEKQRLAEEEAARKKAEAEGPSLEDIPSDELLELIESVREILEFSDKENEIRSMCEQSSIPKALVEIAVSGPEKLDELEEKAGG